MEFKMEQPEDQDKRNISEQKRWEELYTKYSEYSNEKERIQREEVLYPDTLKELNQIISREEIDELRKLSEKTDKNEDPNIRTLADEMELTEIKEKEFPVKGSRVELKEDTEKRKEELMKKSSFYLSDDNILKQVENMEDLDSDS